MLCSPIVDLYKAMSYTGTFHLQIRSTVAMVGASREGFAMAKTTVETPLMRWNVVRRAVHTIHSSHIMSSVETCTVNGDYNYQHI